MSTPEEIRAQALKSFGKNAARLELAGDLIGKSFMYEDQSWKIVGLSKRIRKLPLVAENTEGRFKTFPLEQLNNLSK